MAKQRTHEVKARKDKNKLSIKISKETMIRADRAARRQAQIDAGLLRPCGTGVHGGSDRERNRRDRRDWRQKLRKEQPGD